MNDRDDLLDEFGLGGAERTAAPAQKADPAEDNFSDILARAPSNVAFQTALAKKLAARSPIVQKISPTKKRRYTMGFGPATVPPHSSVVVAAQPRVMFKSEKLINTGDTADLVIENFFIGQNNQFPPGPLPVSAFAQPQSSLSDPTFDVWDPALMMTFNVRNLGGTTATFAVSVIGHAIV